MNYGYFADASREYIITNPRTPVKWINYIGSRAFGGFVDHTGGALICKDDPSFNRITKYIQQMPSSDFKGETLYLRLHSPHGYRVFSPFFVPTLNALDFYECAIGLGYTRIRSQMAGIYTEVTIFVPLGEDREIRRIEITNRSSLPQAIDVIPVVEFTHPNALMQFTNADWVPQTMQARAVIEGDHTVLVEYPFMHQDTCINYFTSNAKVSSFETDRKCFLGDNEYGTFRQPLSLLHEQLGNSQANRGDVVAVLLHELGTLQPDESRTLITQLGQASSLQAAKEGIARFRQPEAVTAALEQLKEFFDNYLSALQVMTPDQNMDRMLNVHNPYQCFVTKTWSRYLSYYQLGMGSRGIGMRDSAQDVMAVVASIPQDAKAFLRTLLSFQKPTGDAIHQFNPLTLEGSEGDSLERPDRPHYYSDDHLWSILAVAAYLKETGDFAFLQEVLPFYEKDKTKDVKETATVFEHLQRGLAFTHQDTGRHGLPLLGYADWNDTINLPTGAESLFTANLYGKALLEVIGLLEYLGRPTQVELYRTWYAEMKARFEASAWDGDWYVRYFTAEGEAVGSHTNQYGQIYLNGQSWPVISGFATPERAKRALQSVYEKLNTRFGIKLSAPGFNGFDSKYGGITTYPPGAKENGGIFLHPNPWAMIAETLLGHGDRAYQYYAQINPVAKNDSIEGYEVEPYVYAQNILGNEHPQFGLGRNSWLSGTASWAYQAATQWILGIRAEFDGLCIDPCIPSSWSGFSATRRFRGQIYEIVVHNPEHSCKGIGRLIFDGQTLNGNRVPIGEPGSHHQIEVWLKG